MGFGVGHCSLASFATVTLCCDRSDLTSRASPALLVSVWQLQSVMTKKWPTNIIITKICLWHCRVALHSMYSVVIHLSLICTQFFCFLIFLFLLLWTFMRQCNQNYFFWMAAHHGINRLCFETVQSWLENSCALLLGRGPEHTCVCGAVSLPSRGCSKNVPH